MTEASELPQSQITNLLQQPKQTTHSWTLNAKTISTAIVT